MEEHDFYETPVQPRGECIVDARIEEICDAVLPAMGALRELSEVLRKNGLYKLSTELLTTAHNISVWQDYTNEVLEENLPPLKLQKK
jgi:hypothetical protein